MEIKYPKSILNGDIPVIHMQLFGAEKGMVSSLLMNSGKTLIITLNYRKTFP